MKSEDNLVGVFHQESDAKCDPDFFVTREEARALKKLNQAYFINHGNDIRLLENIETVVRTAEDNGLRFINPVQSRKITGPGVPERNSSMDSVIDTVFHDRKGRLRPYIHDRMLMKTNRMKPYAVIAAESWA